MPDPEKTPFQDLHAALEAARTTLEIAETDKLIWSAVALFKALQAFTPAELDQHMVPFVARCAVTEPPAIPEPPRVGEREVIHLDTGERVYATERPAGTHLWDLDGREWVCVTRSHNPTLKPLWRWQEVVQTKRYTQGTTSNPAIVHCRDCEGTGRDEVYVGDIDAHDRLHDGKTGAWVSRVPPGM